MDERAAFVRQICENPAEDAVRLVFADWCDENGLPASAEFIRSQLRLARPDWTDNRATRSSLIRRCHARLRPNKVHWCAPLKPAEPGSSGLVGQYVTGKPYGSEMRVVGFLPGYKEPPSRFVLTRGFVSTIRLSLPAFLELAPTLFARHPITRVEFSDREPDVSFGNPHLSLWHRVGDEEEGQFDLADSLIPGVLFDELPPSGPTEHPGYEWSCNRPPERAHDILSHVAVAYGRSLAGLPPLPA